MELRGCSQVHSISVIRGGEVIKMHNITREKPTLKLKNIEHIYVSDGSKSQETWLRHPPKVNRSLAMSNGVVEVKTEVKSECIEEENELDFGTITLKQLKQTCKSKKRKAHKSVNLAEVKQEAFEFPCEEDELELKETLVSFKRKVLKKVKSKKKTCSVSDNFGGKSNDTPNGLLLVKNGSQKCNPLQFEVEDHKPNYEQHEAISYILSDEYGNAASEMAGTVECQSSAQPLVTNVGDLHISVDSLQTPNCALNQMSYDLIQHVGYDLVTTEISCFEEIITLEGSESPQGREEDITDLATCDESPERVLTKLEPFPFQDYHPHSFESDASIIDENLVLLPAICGSESPRDEDMTDPVTCDELPERIVCERDLFALQVYHPNSRKSNSTTSDENLVLLPAICIGEDAQNDDSSKFEGANMQIQTVECNPLDHYVHCEEKNYTANSVTCPEKLTPVIAEKHLSATNERNENIMMPHPPKRLLSSRKVISPTSQERLRKAMNFGEQEDDVEVHSCEEKLLFEKIEADIKRARTLSSSKRPEPAIRRRMKIGKDGRKIPHSRGSVDGTQASQMSQNVGGVCSDVQNCSRNAIAFSKQQVHDIERLATKLMTGLQSMKSIIVDGLQYESRTGSRFRLNTDEVRLAVENVGKVEETAQKWLAMMSRDCNRFCKIMRLAEVNAPSPEKVMEENRCSPETKIVTKQRKIMFADEAGGSLCEVKVFNNVETDMDIDGPVNATVPGQNCRVDIPI